MPLFKLLFRPLVLFSLVIVFPPKPSVVFVAAWGRQGHEIIANLAWRSLTNETKTTITSILQSNKARTCLDCSILAEVADWADIVQHTHAYQWSTPLHYIDVRDDTIKGGCAAGKQEINKECRFEYGRDCPRDFCVAGAIVNYTGILLQYTGAETPLIAESLKFLTHFVGDIHQPLHASRTSDRGGNSIHVRFDGKSKTRNLRGRPVESFPPRRLQRLRHHHYANNLHAVWDDGIIEKCLRDDFNDSRLALEDYLWDWMLQDKNQESIKNWLACPYGAVPRCANAWGQESFENAIRWAYRNVDGSEILSGTNLSVAYHDTRLPIVKERLMAGGVRLAVTLELALHGSWSFDKMLPTTG